MRQALHIFRANALHHRRRIALVLLVEAVGTFVHSQAGEALVVVGFWFLIAGAVHDEPIPGDRQFWVTRPYDWRSLAGAKLLFVLAFVSLPVLLADSVVMAMSGFSPLADPIGLLTRQVLINLWLALPPLALAAVTGSLAQFSGGALMVAVIVIGRPWVGMPFVSGVRPYEFTSSFILAFAAALVLGTALFRQYKWHSTALCRSLVLIALLVRLAPWSQQAAQWMVMRADSGVAAGAVMAVDDTRKPEWEGGSCIALPVRLDENAEPVGAKLVVGNRTSKWLTSISMVEHASGKWVKVCMNQKEFDLVAREGEVAVAATLVVTKWGGSKVVRVPFRSGVMRIPGFGDCQTVEFGLSCASPLRPAPRASVIWEDRGLHLGNLEVGSSRAPFDVLDGLNPIAHEFLLLRNGWRSDFFPGPNTELVVSIRKEPVILRAQLKFARARFTR